MNRLTLIAAIGLAMGSTGASAGGGDDKDDGQVEKHDRTRVDITRSRITEDRDLEIVYDPRTGTPSVRSKGVYALFDAIDTDDNDEITANEAQALEGLPALFSELDRDGDLVLGFREFDDLVAQAY